MHLIPLFALVVGCDGSKLEVGADDTAGSEGDADEVRPEGVEKPLARLMKALAELQTGDADKRPLRTALLTRRTSPAAWYGGATASVTWGRSRPTCCGRKGTRCSSTAS